MVKDQLVKGLREAAEIVTSTLGPKGNYVFIDGETVSTTKDGATVANYVAKHFEGWEKAGAKLLIQAAQNTAKKAGDGTTTTCAMASQLSHCIEEGVSHQFFEELDSRIEKVIEVLENQSLEATEDLIKSVALVSSNHDVSIADVVASVINELGEYGQVVGGVSRKGYTYADTVKGYSCGSSILSPNFLDGHVDSQKIENPYVLIIEKKIERQQELIPLYSKLKKHLTHLYKTTGAIKPVLAIIGDIEPGVAKFMLRNKLQPKKDTIPVNVYPVASPESGMNRYKILHDIGAITGAKVFSAYSSNDIKDFEISDLGEINFAQVGLNGFVINSNADVEDLVEVIKEGDDDEEFKRMRISMLKSGISTIFIDADTNSDLIRKSQVVEDAVLACQSAIKSGVVLGGGHSLMEVAGTIDLHHADKVDNAIEALLSSVFVTLSSGMTDHFFNPDYPFDFLKEAHVPKEDFDVFTPVSVLSTAMKGAASVCKQIFLTKYGVNNDVIK